MAVIYDEPKYPVIDKAPGIQKTVGNFNWRDYGAFAAFPGVAAAVGYISGQKAGVPKQSAVCCTLIGLTAGYMYAFQSSAGRLMGVFQNDAEVKAYGKR